MRTGEQVFYVWEDIFDEKVINKIKKSIQDYKKIGLELDQICLKFQDDEDGTKKQDDEEQNKDAQLKLSGDKK